MRGTLFVLLLTLAGCMKLGDSKVRPEEPGTRPVSYRPITPEMVTPESASKISERLDEELDRDAQRQQAKR